VLTKLDVIPVPPIPNLDAYLAAYGSWVVDLVSSNLIFFGILTIILRWIVLRTPWKCDDRLLSIFNQVISRIITRK
jgi:hypothetical protein